MSGAHFSPFVLLAVLLGYVAVLIAIGAWAEHAARHGRDPTARGWVYALSLTVYCTSWTFFGSVGSAASGGMLYSAIYLGPTLVMVVAWGVIRRMVRLRHRYRFSSIVDLLTQRYGQSLAMGAFITLVLLLGMIPYIALQIRTILGSFTLLTGLDHQADTVWLGHFTDETMVVLIGVLTGLFGLRRVDTRVRQHGMIAVLAAESTVKLAAFVAVGAFVTYGLFDGFQDLYQRVTADRTLTALVHGHGDQPGFYLNWMTYLVLAMAAILFLPRMFHIMVIENHDERHLTTAMWMFPLYLLLISLFVLPIALGGLALGYPASGADWFVIRLPFDHGPVLLTLLAYLGGFSAAVGMVMVACTTMAIMFSNHIVLPIIESSRYGVHLHGRLRGIRWVVVFAMLGLAYWFQKGLGGSYLLIQMGLISFAAMLQFVPAALGALYWRRASRVGAWWGLALGWTVWAYTLFIPALVRSGWGEAVGWVSAGPLGIGFLRPDALFGLDLSSPYFNATFWSLLFNLGGYVLGSILYPPAADEQPVIEGYCAILDDSQASTAADEGDVLIDLARVRTQVGRLFERYLPPPEAELASAQALAELATVNAQALSGRAYLGLSARVESTLAGAIGAAMARKAVVESMTLNEQEMAGLAQTWREQLAELKISPEQLREQVDYFRSLNELSARHAADMEEKIEALEQAALEREHADAALRESELRFRSLADSAPVMVWMTASTRGEDFFNRTWLAFTGRTLAEEAANGWMRGIHPDDLARALTAMETTLERHASIEHEFRLRRHDGEYRHLRVQVVPRYSADGMFLGIIGSAIDITDLKTAEATLRRSNEDLEARVSERTAEMLRAKAWSEDIIRLAPNMVIGLDAAGNIVLFNDYAEHLTGYRRTQVLGRNWLQQFVPEDHRAALGAILDEAAATGQVLHNNEHPVLLRDGSERTISWHSQTMLEDGKLKMVLSFGVDVTERRRAEKALKKSNADLKQLNQRLEQAQNQLLQSEKMASIGQLAAGVAHEINNPVGFVSSNFGTLKIYCEQMLGLLAAYQASEGEITDPAARQTIAELKHALDIDYLREDLPALIRESEDGLQRVKKIVQDLKDFSHVNESEWQFADLNAGLDSTLNVVWNEVKYKATVVKQYGTLPEVECLAAQLNQVFMNLIINAVHALDPAKGMGTLTLSTGQQGDEVWIEVADSGRGMSEEVQRRIFEPFYTTKPVGKGTGLGLSLSFSIIQKHQGRIEVDSVPDQGSRFRVWVPIRRPAPATAAT